jgi:hypothetical protein
LLSLLLLAGPAVVGKAHAGESDLGQDVEVIAGMPGSAGAKIDLAPKTRKTAYREHAPLALFSLGSLAVGGVFYGIHSSLDEDGGGRMVSGNGSRMDMALGAAGISALAAGAAYFYYSLHGRDASEEEDRTWISNLSAGMGPDGGVAASLTLPLPSLIP